MQELEDIVFFLKGTLKDNLVGIYLHGSIAMNCYHPNKSDIDLIIVVEDALDKKLKRKILEFLVLSKKPYELSIVLKEICKNFIYPTPYDFHYSISYLSNALDDPDAYINQMCGVDYDLAAHFKVIYERGIVLYGSNIEECFKDISRKDYLDSILRDFKDYKLSLSKNPTYYILNTCRIIAYLKENKIFSKEEAGEYFLQKCDKKYHFLVSLALKNRYLEIEEVYPLSEVFDFLKHFENILNNY